jgi:hypothetical protein
VKEQRWPWLLAAGLMLVSAVAAAWSTYLYWLPCRGSMLEGTLLQPFSGDGRTYVEWSALVALAVVWAWQPEVRTRRRFLRLAVAVWGTTAFGIFHQMLAYMIMVGFSERDWDEPPGTGYLTVAAITISAILIVIMTLRMTPRAAEADPKPSPHVRVPA